MFERLMTAIRRALSLETPEQSHPIRINIDPEALKEIEFRSLDPASEPVGGAQPLLCPVTRQELKQPERIFQCRACSTCYSEAGWAFLRDVDRGKCCACGTRKSVFPL